LHEEAQLTERATAHPQSVPLETRMIEKPWGRTRLPAPFTNGGRGKIGEIWFEHPDRDDLPLLVKYIFTSEKLSIQVHPDDAQARKRGFQNGKTECWYVLEAEPDSRLGLGLKSELSSADIRSAALDGSIEELMDWKPVRAGDCILVPAGTIHAIGAGIALLEFQQNIDLTYRLYDYGRPRELHLDDAVDVSRSDFDAEACFRRSGESEGVLVDSEHFSLIRAHRAEDLPDEIAGKRRWIMPLDGSVTAGGATVEAGGCLLAAPGQLIDLSPSASVLVGVKGSLQKS
jgi:mannose-6-phosphate isomerase